MVQTSNVSFERDYLNSLKKGFEKFLKYHPKVLFHHSIRTQYLVLFDKAITAKTIDDYRKLTPSVIKVLIDNYAKSKNIEIVEKKVIPDE